MFKRSLILLSAAALFTSEPLTASARETDTFPETSAAAVCLYEAESGNVILERGDDESRPVGHLAKLMTALICAEKCDSGEMSFSDTVKVSANANSKQGAQIWLDAGEEITIGELMRSIIIGNANDACCALAEQLSGSEGDHVTRLNERADKLGMKHTRFADVLGESESTVSTAYDIALLSAELSKHDELTKLFTTRIDSVRGGKAELVNNNRLILSYKGILGTKACGGERSGECIAACARKNGMTLCAVLLGEPVADTKLDDAETLLDTGFEKYRIFSPDIDKKYTSPIPVTGGCKNTVRVKISDDPPALIKAGTAGDVELTSELPEILEAPVKRGSVLGKLVYTLDGKQILEKDIVAAEDAERINMSFAFHKALLKLLNLF